MLDAAARRNGGRLGLAALAAIVLLGLGLRLGEAWDGRPPVYDARAYAAIAANLQRGEGFTVGPGATQPSSNYSPGLPLLVAGLYGLGGGPHERAARLLLALIGALAVPLSYLLGRHLVARLEGARSPAGAGRGPAWAGIAAAVVVAVYPPLLEYQGMLMSEPLAATLLCAAVLAIFWARHSLARWLAPGALLGALTLVRPEYLGVSLLLALVVLVGCRGEGWRRSLAAAATMLAAVAIVVAPWTVRNLDALGRFVPVSTGGGQVLFAGTYLPSGGDPEAVGAEVVARHPGIFAPADADRLRLEQILARLAQRRYPAMDADRALSRMGRERLLEELGSDPIGYARFIAAKVGRVWFHPARAAMHGTGGRAFQWALVLLGLLGLCLLALPRGALGQRCGGRSPSPWEASVIATIIVAITALSAVLVASPRRFLVLLPLVAALAGVGLVAGLGRRGAQSRS